MKALNYWIIAVSFFVGLALLDNFLDELAKPYRPNPCKIDADSRACIDYERWLERNDLIEISN